MHTLKYLVAALFVIIAPIKAVADEPITLGTIHSLSSWGARVGQSELNAAILAVEEINAAGGINGRRLALVSEDNNSQLKQNVVAVEKLTSVDKVPAILGPNYAEFSEVAAPVVQAKKTVMVTASGYTRTLTQGREYIFSLLPSHETFTRPLSQYITIQKPEKLAILVTRNAYYESLKRSISLQLEAQGITIWKTLEFDPDINDYRSVITQLKNQKVDSVLTLLMENGPNAAFLRQAREQTFRPKIYASNSLAFDPLLTSHRSIAEGVIFFDFSVQGDQSFKDRYFKKYGTIPAFSAAMSYDSAHMVASALKECGVTAEMIRDCLAKMIWQGASGRIHFNADRNVVGLEGISKLFRIVKGEIAELQ